MLQDNKLWIGQGENPCYLMLDQANRHGVICGASGTGKTVTMKQMAEGFSQAGIPVFMADVKGDVAGIAEPGLPSEKIDERLRGIGIDPTTFKFEGSPVRLWSMDPAYKGIPVRITISDMGPVMLARMLDLNDVQSGVLSIVFRIADDNQLLLIDLKDLRAMLGYVLEHASDYTTTYGRVAESSISAIMRALLTLEDQGADNFFGEPALDLKSFFGCDERGRGYINVLNAESIINHPDVYAMFLLWMMGELFETLDEVGDLEKPRFVFFFDEAHVLFKDMPKALLDKITQVVKLVRSKGVGVYFVTQSPADIPDEVLAQLSNRVQHGLRAYTPSELKAVTVAAESFRENPNFNSADVIKELATGEALVSFLDETGTPCVAERATILPPQCSMSTPDSAFIDRCMNNAADLLAIYGTAVDRESAFEKLDAQAAENAEAARLAAERAAFEAEKAAFEKQKAKDDEAATKAAAKEAAALERAQRKAQEAEEKARQKEAERRAAAFNKNVQSVIGTVGREVTRQIVRNIFGGLKK